MGRRVCEEPGCGAALYPGDEGGLCFTCAARRRAAGRAVRRTVLATTPAEAPAEAAASAASGSPVPATPAPSEPPCGGEPEMALARPSAPPARDAVPTRRPGRPPLPPGKRKPKTAVRPRPCEGAGCERMVTGHRPSVLCPSCAARKRAAEQRARQAEAPPEPPARRSAPSPAAARRSSAAGRATARPVPRAVRESDGPASVPQCASTGAARRRSRGGRSPDGVGATRCGCGPRRPRRRCDAAVRATAGVPWGSLRAPDLSERARPVLVGGRSPRWPSGCRPHRDRSRSTSSG
jgi:hypothetical protein